MSAIINALFGTYPDADAHAQNAANNHTTTVEGTSGVTERLHTSAVADDVQVRSVISSETQARATSTNKLNIDGLLSQLGTTHSQVDAYSRARTAAINEQVKQAIADVLARTQKLQEELLVDANGRHLVIDNEYKLQLQKAVEALDAVKAKTLAELEHELQGKQQAIMVEAKREIDVLNDQANAAKLHALVEAQEQANKDVAQLSDQVAAMGQLDTQNLLRSTTTTVITSKSEASGAAEAVVVPVVETKLNSLETAAIVNTLQSQVAANPSEIVFVPTTSTLTSTETGSTAFGTATGASNLTTTPASVVSTESHITTKVQSPPDNTNF